MHVTKKPRKMRWYIEYVGKVERTCKPHMRIQLKSKRAVVMIHNRLWIESKGSSTLTVLRETIQNLRAEAISWSHLKFEVERSLEIYKTRQSDAVDLSNVFNRAWNNLKARAGGISLQRQSNYFCGARLHHWNFVVGKVEIGSGSHEDKREAFRLAAISAAEFLLRLDDGQNERRWRPNCNESDSSESSDDCELLFVRSAGSGPIATEALINLSDSSLENAIEAEPSPSTSTPPREDSVDAENIEMFSQDQSVTAATSFDRDSDGEAMSELTSPPSTMSVTLHTTLGDIKIEVCCDTAPRTAENFLALCASGAYDGTKFHRNMKGFMVQGGDPTSTGKGGQSIWGGAIDDEFHPQNRHNCRGIVSMANSGPNTNKQQFFIAYAKQPHLNNVYTVFGKVIDGMDTLDAMEKTPVDAKNRPLKEIVIKSVTIHANPIADM
ncbi:hypothetical protein PR001_g3483 [Phytophthora rubi]|uniref:PPIase cyclophilin-type domain-containing protein n=2 Tax=Phytophthora rubi TaxID=129364 RepID=A0A6A3NC26_9STRA|nr:hypothetical protein PR002_g3597 [Phytophthora rubi]KAE9049256.1 hypothetical protein PR001_g3483 [Phytophthora rubi]